MQLRQQKFILPTTRKGLANFACGVTLDEVKFQGQQRSSEPLPLADILIDVREALQKASDPPPADILITLAGLMAAYPGMESAVPSDTSLSALHTHLGAGQPNLARDDLPNIRQDAAHLRELRDVMLKYAESWKRKADFVQHARETGEGEEEVEKRVKEAKKTLESEDPLQKKHSRSRANKEKYRQAAKTFSDETLLAAYSAAGMGYVDLAARLANAASLFDQIADRAETLLTSGRKGGKGGSDKGI